MAHFYSLVSNGVGGTHPDLKPLAAKLDEFRLQFFVVDSQLRHFGQGYLCVTDRWFEYFEAALGPGSGETPEETATLMGSLDSEIAKLGEILSGAQELRDRVIPALPQRDQDSMRTKLLVNAIGHAERLHACVGERRRAVAEKFTAT